MSPIPLGILNMDFITNPEFHKSSEKPFLCLMHHRVRNGLHQWKDRKRFNEKAKKWLFVKCIEIEMKRESSLNLLKASKFCFCIHGGGYDPCPRFFECILYGTIPIVQHSHLDPILELFPVVFYEEDEFSEDFLLKKYEELKEYYVEPKRSKVLNLLTLDYWWNTITTYFN
jgi:hypothetical protein